MSTLRWADVSAAPAKPGIYAWYYSPEITSFDLREAITNINLLRNEGSEDKARSYVRRFLEEALFKFFRALPYQARIFGPLKPSHEGCLEHTLDISESLIGRIVSHPERLNSIRDVLEASAPSFSSPLYIGMSDNLRSRLARHKWLIEKYRDTSGRIDESDSDLYVADASFALEVARRRFPPDRLFVEVCVLEVDVDPKDVENILNRICYPVLGRN